jgi:hypothetical protein
MVLSDQVLLISVEMTNAIGYLAGFGIIGVIITVIISIVAGVFTFASFGDSGSIIRTTATSKNAVKPEDNQFLDYLSGWLARVKQYW